MVQRHMYTLQAAHSQCEKTILSFHYDTTAVAACMRCLLRCTGFCLTAAACCLLVLSEDLPTSAVVDEVEGCSINLPAHRHLHRTVIDEHHLHWNQNACSHWSIMDRCQLCFSVDMCLLNTACICDDRLLHAVCISVKEGGVSSAARTWSQHACLPLKQVPGGGILLECSLKDPGVHHLDRFVWVTSHKRPLAIVGCKCLFAWDLHCQLNPG